jgi:hypothetical protein
MTTAQPNIPTASQSNGPELCNPEIMKQLEMNVKSNNEMKSCLDFIGEQCVNDGATTLEISECRKVALASEDCRAASSYFRSLIMSFSRPCIYDNVNLMDLVKQLQPDVNVDQTCDESDVQAVVTKLLGNQLISSCVQEIGVECLMNPDSPTCASRESQSMACQGATELVNNRIEKLKLPCKVLVMKLMGTPQLAQNAPDGTPSVTMEPTLDGTPSVTMEPTLDGTSSVTMEPTLDGTPSVTMEPTLDGTSSVTMEPTLDGTPSVTMEPTLDGTSSVTMEPSLDGTSSVTMEPTLDGTPSVTMEPTLDGTPSYVFVD